MASIEVTKGHRSFMEFLDQELPALGMVHWYGSFDRLSMGIDYHDIGKVVIAEQRFLFITWTTKYPLLVANVIAEPDTPLYHGAKDAFRLRVKDKEMLPALQTLAEKFERANFGLKVELVY